MIMQKCRVSVVAFTAVLICLYAEPSCAAISHVVKIRQSNLDGVPQKAICRDYKECLVPIVLEYDADHKEPLIARITFRPGNVMFKFQTRGGYFYVGDEKHGASTVIWHNALGPDEHVDENLTLFLPAVPSANIDSMYQAPVLNVTHQAVADLEINVDKAP
jgi:hypothetical protein